MKRIVGIGKQSFVDLIENNCFYVDKTKFIKEWWDGQDDVTLITRPRRFGKTLMLDTIKTFFSPEFERKANLFEGLEIWRYQKFRELHAKVPVIFISFADVKGLNFEETKLLINEILTEQYNKFRKVLDIDMLLDTEKEQFLSVRRSMDKTTAQTSLRNLAKYLSDQNFGKPLILLDEYDTPLQEGWLRGYWDELVDFLRSFFNSTFKTNTFLKKGLITGITRVSKESIFSDMNNLETVGVTSDLYADCFGFTETEVFNAMDEYGLKDKKKVKYWYDGFIFGKRKQIYNPWSIINYLKKGELDTYWAQTSSNSLVSKLIAKSEASVKEETGVLIRGEAIVTKLDEQLVFSQLYRKKGAVWSLLMAAGYVKPLSYDHESKSYKIALTNHEVFLIFKDIISDWFFDVSDKCTFFQDALMSDNVEDMNIFINDISENIFSFFDTAKPEPERFYHAFVLGLIVNLKNRYTILSNRQSGYGRYDLAMIPMHQSDHGIIIEFKVMREGIEKNLEETCKNALKQIKEKKYINDLLSRNVHLDNIYIYGFSFKGKNVLVRGGLNSKIEFS